MKKKRIEQSEAAVSNVAKDYVVGLVSGSLGSNQTSSSSGALSSLFSATSSNTFTFVPAQKVEPEAIKRKHEADEVPEETPKQKKTPKEKSKAEKKLQDREGGLKNADDEDVEKIQKKVKHKALVKHDRETLDEERPFNRKRIWKNPAEERIKLKRTIFLGNLPVSYQKKNVKRIFKDLGDIESVRFRSAVREDPSMSRKLATIRRQVDPKRQSINAYVVFKDEKGAENALQRNGMEIEKDIYIRVDRAAKHHSHDHKRSIFVGNLPYDITELPIRQHFEECGNVEAVRLVRDRNSGVGKGFGYVLFESADAVMLALKLTGSQLQDRTIRVKRSVKKEKVKNGPGPVGRNAKEPSGKGVEKRKSPQLGGFKGSRGPDRNKSDGKFKKNPGMRNRNSSSFKGEMADPNKKPGKGLKKRFKPKTKNKRART